MTEGQYVIREVLSLMTMIKENITKDVCMYVYMYNRGGRGVSIKVTENSFWILLNS